MVNGLQGKNIKGVGWSRAELLSSWHPRSRVGNSIRVEGTRHHPCNTQTLTEVCSLVLWVTAKPTKFNTLEAICSGPLWNGRLKYCLHARNYSNDFKKLKILKENIEPDTISGFSDMIMYVSL